MKTTPTFAKIDLVPHEMEPRDLSKVKFVQVKPGETLAEAVARVEAESTNRDQISERPTDGLQNGNR